jgi:anti-sigma B factor antagonist
MVAVQFDTGQLQVRHEVRGSAVVVRASGELDLATAPALDEDLCRAEVAAGALAEPPGWIVLDLTALRFLGSIGLALLVQHQQRCAERVIPLRVVADHYAVLRPVQIAGLTDLLSIHPSLHQALQPAA